MSDFLKKVVTHREADIATVALAMWMLDWSSATLRDKGPESLPYPSDGGLMAGGYVSQDPDQTWWSYDPETVTQMGEGTNIPYPSTRYDTLPSAICWYSVQNLIRLRLREARKEIQNARLPQRSPFKSSRQMSRNKDGRKKPSA